MRSGWTQSFALAAMTTAAALASPTRAEAGDGSCELSRVDRGSTTSTACMACHDGSAGARIGFQMSPDGRGMEHPVTVDYARAFAAHPDQFHPPHALPASVPLVRGRIECTTCHDGASRDPKRVAAVRDLCLACHRL